MRLLGLCCTTASRGLLVVLITEPADAFAAWIGALVLLLLEVHHTGPMQSELCGAELVLVPPGLEEVAAACLLSSQGVGTSCTCSRLGDIASVCWEPGPVAWLDMRALAAADKLAKRCSLRSMFASLYSLVVAAVIVRWRGLTLLDSHKGSHLSCQSAAILNRDHHIYRTNKNTLRPTILTPTGPTQD